MTEADPQPPNLATELALLVALATLWGASYTFIRIGVATIPPITLIAGRTAIAGLLLLVIMRCARREDADRCRDLAALPVSGRPEQRHPLDHGRLGRAHARCGAGDHPQFDRADLHVFPDAAVTRHEALTSRKLIGVVAGMVGICLIVGVQALAGLGRAIDGADRHAAGRGLLRGCCDLRPRLQGPRSDGAGGRLAVVRRGDPDPVSLVVEQPWTLTPSTDSLLALLGLAVFSTAFAFVIYFRLIQTLGSVGTTAQAYLRVPIGVGLGSCSSASGRVATAWIGLACVVIGVAAMTIPARKVAAASSNRPAASRDSPVSRDEKPVALLYRRLPASCRQIRRARALQRTIRAGHLR